MSTFDFSLGDDSTSNTASGALREYRLWRRSNPSSAFSQYLEDRSSLETSVVIELATTDLIQQISTGHDSRAEEYIEAIASFSTSPDLSLDLVDAELCAKSDVGTPVDQNELLERFPTLQDDLSRLLEVHELDLKASKNRSAPRSAPIAIQGYDLERRVNERSSKHSPVRFQLWDAIELSRHRRVQIVLWRDRGSRSKESFVSTMERRSQIQHRSLFSPVSAGKANSNKRRYCYIVVKRKAVQTLSQLHNLASECEFSEIAIAQMLLNIIDAANKIEEALGVSIPLSTEMIALTDSGKPLLIDFPALANQQDCTPLRRLGLLMFATCLQDSDTRALQIHLDAGYEPIDLFEINPSISREMNSIYASCVHPKEKKRYVSIDDAIEDLKRLVDGKPIKSPCHKRNWFGF